MDFEKILPFLVLLIYIFSLFGKKKAAEKDKPAKPEKSALKSIIQTIARQMKERAEEMKKQEARRTRTQPEPDARSLSEAVFSPQKDPQARPDAAAEQAAADEPEEMIEEILLDVPVEALEAAPDAEPVCGRRRRRMRSLQEAVIWSEILGPPVALRDHHRKLF